MADEDVPNSPQPTAEQRPAAAELKERSTKATNSLYRVFWRWHFYAGIVCAPIFLTVTITGAIYVFKDELEHSFGGDHLFVTQGESRTSYDQQLAAARTALAAQGVSDVDLRFLILSPDENRSTLIYAREKTNRSKRYEIFVDPFTGKVLLLRGADTGFFRIVLLLHRRLMLGKPGRVVVELVTCWSVILLVTGLYLWWPRGKKNAGTFFPRLRTKKRYVLYRDLHAVPAAYCWILSMLIVATGLFFTLVWGTGFLLMGVVTGHLNPDILLPPAVESVEGKEPLSVDEVVQLLAPVRGDLPMELHLSTDSSLGYLAIFFDPERVTSARSAMVDQHQGEIVKRIDLVDAPAVYQTRVYALTIHTGTIFGTPTKIAAFVASLVLIASCVTGLMMWWKRRPSGTWGIPRGRLNLPVPWPLLILSCLLGLLMPIFGLSLLLILGGEKLASRRSNH